MTDIGSHSDRPGKPTGGQPGGRVSTCPTCGEPLEATVRLYLVDVVVEKARVVEAEIDYHEGQETILDYANDGIVDLHLMCPQDHDCDDLLITENEEA